MQLYFKKNLIVVNAMARLLLRHDEQLTALTSEVTFVSYAKTEDHCAANSLCGESPTQE